MAEARPRWRGWRYHGEPSYYGLTDPNLTDGDQYSWIAALGPDTVATGEAASTERITIGQIAATVGALLGEDFGRSGETKKAAPPIEALLPKAIRGQVAVAIGIGTCRIKVVRAAACEHQPLARLCHARGCRWV